MTYDLMEKVNLFILITTTVICLFGIAMVILNILRRGKKMRQLHKKKKETATTIMAELERARCLACVSQLPETIDRIFDDITEIKSMLKQIMKYLRRKNEK